MILKPKVMYQLYIKELSIKIDKAIKEQKELKEEQCKLLKLLNTYKVAINQTYEISYDKLINFTSVKAFKKIANVNTNKIIEVYFIKLVRVNRKISTLTTQVNKAKEEIIPYTVYNKIISKFNQKMIDAVVFDNYYFKPSSFFGAITIVVKKETIPKIDWGKSNKKKKLLKEKGLTPYKKADEELAIKEGKPYNGIDWLVNLPLINYYFYWAKNKIQKELIPIIGDYKFVPARRRTADILGPVRKLQTVKEDGNRAALLYTRKIKKDDN